MILENFKNEGNGFSKELIQEFKNLRSGDKINFYDVTVKGADGTTRIVKPLRLIVDESK
jgi:hypothetical protein